MGVPCTRCVSHTGYLAHGNSKDKTRGRNPRIIAKEYDIEERNVGTIIGKVPNKA